MQAGFLLGKSVRWEDPEVEKRRQAHEKVMDLNRAEKEETDRFSREETYGSALRSLTEALAGAGQDLPTEVRTELAAALQAKDFARIRQLLSPEQFQVLSAGLSPKEASILRFLLF